MGVKDKLNGNSKWLLHGLAYLLVAILGFAGRWAFIEITTAREVYATKMEVSELKQDVCNDIREIKDDLKYIRRHLLEAHESGE